MVQAATVRVRTLALACALLVPAAAAAQNESAQPDSSNGKNVANTGPSWAGDLDTRTALLGAIGGIRPLLDRYGVSFGLTEITESLGNPAGGLKPGGIVEGLTQMSVGADLSKTLGLDDTIFNVSAYQIHGRGLTLDNVGALNIISNIEADPTTRLNELWIQKSFWDGKLDIKVGQQSADFEFITSEYEDLFINSGFGWPTLPALDLPSGGPAYPLPAPAIRLRIKPDETWTALLGVFDGSPGGLRLGDPQIADASGTRFNLGDGVFAIGEVQYAVNGDKDATGLKGTYKIGAWYNSDRFADAFYDQGQTLNPPGEIEGIPSTKRGTWSVYGTIDQLVWKPKADDDGGLAVTARAMGAPSDRNLIDLFLQGGVSYKGPFGRANDTVGLGVEWARISPRVRDGEVAAFAAGIPTIVQTSETVIEATYQAQIKPWWQLQPDLQVVVNPGAGLARPDDAGKRVGTALVLGMRSIVTF